MANSTLNTVLTNLKDMSWPERFDYIWTYFKVHILIAVMGGGLLLGIAVNLLFPSNTVLDIVALNTDITTVRLEETFDPFLAEYGYKTGSGSISFAQYRIADQADTANQELIMALLMQFSNEQDLFIGTGALYEDVAGQGVLQDLRQILPAEQLQQLTLLYTDEGGEAEPYPCAVLVKQNGVFSTDCYVGVCFSSAHPQAAVDFLNYLLSL